MGGGEGAACRFTKPAAARHACCLSCVGLLSTIAPLHGTEPHQATLPTPHHSHCRHAPLPHLGGVHVGLALQVSDERCRGGGGWVHAELVLQHQFLLQLQVVRCDNIHCGPLLAQELGSVSGRRCRSRARRRHGWGLWGWRVTSLAMECCAALQGLAGAASRGAPVWCGSVGSPPGRLAVSGQHNWAV